MFYIKDRRVKAREVGQSVESLLSKHGDLSLSLQHPLSVIPALGWRATVVGATGQPSRQSGSSAVRNALSESIRKRRRTECR